MPERTHASEPGSQSQGARLARRPANAVARLQGAMGNQAVGAMLARDTKDKTGSKQVKPVEKGATPPYLEIEASGSSRSARAVSTSTDGVRRRTYAGTCPTRRSGAGASLPTMRRSQSQPIR